jgi:hypothetical protein
MLLQHGTRCCTGDDWAHIDDVPQSVKALMEYDP